MEGFKKTISILLLSALLTVLLPIGNIRVIAANDWDTVNSCSSISVSGGGTSTSDKLFFSTDSVTKSNTGQTIVHAFTVKEFASAGFNPNSDTPTSRWNDSKSYKFDKRDGENLLYNHVPPAEESSLNIVLEVSTSSWNGTFQVPSGNNDPYSKWLKNFVLKFNGCSGSGGETGSGSAGGGGGTPPNPPTSQPQDAIDRYEEMQNCGAHVSSSAPIGGAFSFTALSFINSGRNAKVDFKRPNGGVDVKSFSYLKTESQSVSRYGTVPVLQYKLTDDAVLFVAMTPDDPLVIKNPNQPTQQFDNNDWKGWFNGLQLKLSCSVFSSTFENINAGTNIDRGDANGPPRIVLPDNSAMNRPSMRFVLGYMISGVGANLNDRTFYFMYDKTLQNGSEVKETKYNKFAVRITISAYTVNLFAIYTGEINNPTDDSDMGNTHTRALFNYAGVTMNDDAIADYLINRVYNKRDGTKVTPENCANCVDTAKPDWNGGLLPPSPSVLNDFGMDITNQPDIKNKTPKGWLAHWGVKGNSSSITDPTGETTDEYCPGYSGSTIFNDLGKAFEGAICNVFAFLHKLSAGLFDWAMEWLKKAIGFQTSTN